MKQNLTIEGMHCTSCSQIISSKLSKLSGIHSCEVNFINKNADIDYDPQIISLQKISQEINKYGYNLVMPAQDTSNSSKDPNPNNQDKIIDGSWKKVLISIPLVSIAIITMLYMIGIDYQRRPKNLFRHHLLMGLLPIFATIMLTVVGFKYIIAIFRYIRYGVANMDTLVGIGTVTAFIYSFISKTFYELRPEILSKQVFFEAVIVVIGFIEFGKYMEAKIMSKSGNAIQALLGLQAKQATILKDNKQIQIPIQQVQIGDIMIVKPGEKIPLDGIIIQGKAHIDESMITGEPLAVSKNIDDQVIGSTIVTDSNIQVQATAIGEDTYLNKIINIVQQAQTSKPQIQKLADKIMRYFIPSALIIATLALLFRLFIAPNFYPDINHVQFAIISFVGVLVIACPCGLGLATPMAIITGIQHGAQNGILAKNAEGLLKLRKSKIVVFDKTGTITQGKPKLLEIQSLQNNTDDLSILASLESLSSHPIAQAILDYAKQNKLKIQQVQDFKNLPGIGVQGQINNQTYTICKPSHLDKSNIIYDQKTIDTRASQGKTPLILLQDQNILGYYAVSDPIKTSSKQAIQDLKSQGIIPVMLTGDHDNTAKYVASLIGIDRIYSQVKPDQKAQIIKQLQKEGIVTMVGDGINDAPALATADIGIAMSTGTDVAIQSAQLTLLHGDLSKLVKAIKISKLTQAAIIQNLTRAFGFNIIGIPLAAGIFYPILGILLNPAFEGAAMAMSSLTVMINSLRLQKKKI